MKSLSKLFKVVIALAVITTSVPIYNQVVPLDYEINEVAVQAATKPMTSSSYFSLTDIVSKYKIPYTAYEVLGTNAGVYNNRTRLYPNDPNATKNYWGSSLPFALRADGTTYVGYCAQSYVSASAAMTVKGQISDPRILKLIYVGSGKTTHYPSLDRQIAIQIVLWGALNYDWRSDLFSSNWISTNAGAYVGMTGVRQYVQEIASEWSYITNTSVKSLINVEPAKKEITGQCKQQATADTNVNPVFQVDWKFVNGDTPTNIDSIADITYSGASMTVYKGSTPSTAIKLQEYGITPEKSSHYIILNTAQSSGSASIVANIVYKNEYQPLNELVLVAYGGASKNQPFIMPLSEKNDIRIELSWNCPTPPPTVPDVSTPSDSYTTKNLRWYNMPLAFGEIKAGKGSNLTSKSLEGKYVANRNEEPYDVLTGVPNSERLYVNLGGTEGFIDVTYSYFDRKQEFVVSWASPWRYTYKCGKKTCTRTGTNYFEDKYEWKFKYLHLVKATFRPLVSGTVSQNDLDIRVDIDNRLMDKGSYELKPNAEGLKSDPGVGYDIHNMGSTVSWRPAQGRFTTSRVNGRQSVKSDRQSQAHKSANSAVGTLFAQNDALSITINNQTYVIVPSNNRKTSNPFVTTGNYTLDATGGEGLDYFKPRKENWNVWTKIPVTGYTGNPTAGANRNVDGTPMLLEDYQLMPETPNGLYEFQDDEGGNRLNYSNVATVIRGGETGLNRTVDSLSDGNNTGTQTVYGNAKNPTDVNTHINGNYVNIQYTNWQLPNPNNSTIAGFSFAGKKPDGNKNSSLTSNPTYRSLNPIVIHNPTTALYSWVHDVGDNQLQDQRIKTGVNNIDKYTANSKTPRTYIDFDFKLSIPNKAAFNTYWGQTSLRDYGNSFIDANHTSPGTLGKGYTGAASSKDDARDSTNPYSSTSGLDVSKWTNGKYVKFPFDVYYYKNSDEEGGDREGFYDADTWIKLYDDYFDYNSGDPTEFNFRVASSQKDLRNGLVYIVTEASNVPEELANNPQELYESSEQYVNGTRSKVSTSRGAYTTGRDAEALYSASNVISVDTIGRLGNLVVSNTTDPAWDKVFNPTNSRTKNNNYGLTFNMYETTVYPNNASGAAAYDRFSTLSPYLNDTTPKGSLPITTNFLTSGKTNQTVKLGYAISGSLQTVGDYDYSVEILPMHQLSGTFKTGSPANKFLLLASNPYEPGASIGQYYDSRVNNSLQNGDNGTVQNASVYGGAYTPTYKHNITTTLADPTLKLSAWEKASNTYQLAVQKGSASKVSLGTPSRITIPKELRTLIGKDTTIGRVGLANTNDNNAQGVYNGWGSSDCLCSYENAQKWNWSFSLPQNTKIWFNSISSNTLGNGSVVTEAPTSNQYLVTSFSMRTRTARTNIASDGVDSQESVDNPAIYSSSQRYQLVANNQQIADWDLAMFTNTGSSGLPNIAGSTRNLPTGFSLVTTPNNNKGWDYTQSSKYSSPRIPVVWWDYSNQSTTDEETIGTH